LSAGDELPSVREVAAAHAINPMTVSKAYSQLETEGLLVRRRGKGMAVAQQATSSGVDARWELIEPSLVAVARRAVELELTAGEVLVRRRRRMELEGENG